MVEMFGNKILLLIGLSFLELGESAKFNKNSKSLTTLQNYNLNLKTPDIITKYGYPVETHTVATEDGYLLTVHRIPGSPRAASSGVKTPVFLQHAFMMASDVWVAAGPERSLGFLLADQGYDVWMGNARGNLYSRSHATLSPNSRKFWDFSWHEMGVYDLPTVIDHILFTTNQKQLFYVGLSMGTTMFFVLTSMRPEYNQKIRLMVALAPVVFDGQTRSSAFETIMTIVGNSDLTEVFSRTKSINNFIKFVCQDGSVLQGICLTLYFQLSGYNSKETNTTLLPLYISRLSSGTSRGTFEHFQHICKTDRFQILDRGARRRGYIATMPEYNLSRVTVPVAIMYAENDAIARPKGVLQLSKSLPNVVRIIKLADDSASHGDFAFSTNVKRLVNDIVIRLLQ